MFTESKWDNKRRAWMPGLSKFGLVVVLFAAVLAVAAVTQLDLTSQVKGILPVTNGGTGTSSALTGIVRGGTPHTAAELSGDATTSGSNAVTVAKVNGTSVPTNSAADQVLLTNAAATGTWAAVNNCGDGTHALSYSTSTHTFGCQAVTGANFADSETPTGTIDGTNAAFTLAHAPAGTSLQLFKNGQQMIAGASADYTLSSSTITYTSGAKPKSGDVHIAFYRY